jgi:hypothetical protein
MSRKLQIGWQRFPALMAIPSPCWGFLWAVKWRYSPAALIVGGIVSIVGFVMINSGKNKFDPSSLKPERTQRALQQDKEMVERRMQ